MTRRKMQEQGIDPRLAPVVKADGCADLRKIGELRERDLNGEPLSARHRAALDALLERDDAALVFPAARKVHTRHLERRVQFFGGTIRTVHSRLHNGPRVTVESFEPRVGRAPAITASRCSPRARGAGRPAARRGTRSASSSSDDPGEGGDEPPPPLRLAPPPRAAYAFGCLTPEQRGEDRTVEVLS